VGALIYVSIASRVELFVSKVFYWIKIKKKQYRRLPLYADFLSAILRIECDLNYGISEEHNPPMLIICEFVKCELIVKFLIYRIWRGPPVLCFSLDIVKKL